MEQDQPVTEEKSPEQKTLDCVRRFAPLVVAFLLRLTLPVEAQTVSVETNNALDLSHSYVTFGKASQLGLPTFTIELWFKLWFKQGAPGSALHTGTGGVRAIPLVAKGRGEEDGTNRDMNYFLGIRKSDNVLVADFEEGSAGSHPGFNHPVVGKSPLRKGVWHHAAATYDGSKWQLFLNGVLEAELFVGEPSRSDSIQHVGLGTALNSLGEPAGFFDGIIDEVRIWNHARTAQQMQKNLNRQITTPEPGLVARWGLNEGNGTSVGDSTANTIDGKIVGRNWNWVPGAPFNIRVNLSPDPPILVAPSSKEVDVSTSPPLKVSVSDPGNDNLTVTFQGRPVKEGSPIVHPDFTIIVVPDTQFYSESFPDIFKAQTKWIVDNKDALNIVYVAHVGDLVQNGDGLPGNPNTQEWNIAHVAMALLEDPVLTKLPQGIPYGIAVGNHDQGEEGYEGAPGSTKLYNEYFGKSRFQDKAYYGGHFGTKNDNHFDLFSASGMNFIVIYIEYNLSMQSDGPVLLWADDLLKKYSDRRAIVISHHIIGTYDIFGTRASDELTNLGTQGQAIYDALKDNPNLFLMLAGHVPGEGRRQDTFNGNTVPTLLSNYQSRENGGDGWLRILEFSPAKNQIRVRTYSPTRKEFEPDPDSEFALPYDTNTNSFKVVATNRNVPSGSMTSVVWEGLSSSVRYQWKVTVNDGISMTTGPIWEFTTRRPQSRLPN